MRHISDDQLEKWKTTFAKDGILYNSDDEYREAVKNLIGFFEILVEIDQNLKKSKDSNDEDGGMYVFDRDGNKVIL